MLGDANEVKVLLDVVCVLKDICFCLGLMSYLAARSSKKARFAAVKSVEEVVMAAIWMTAGLSSRKWDCCFNLEFARGTNWHRKLSKGFQAFRPSYVDVIVLGGLR